MSIFKITFVLNTFVKKCIWYPQTKILLLKRGAEFILRLRDLALHRCSSGFCLIPKIVSNGERQIRRWCHVICRMSKWRNMAENAVPVTQQQTKPIKVKKWKVRQGSTVPLGRIILIYEFTDAEKPEQRKFKATGAGIIHKILATEGKVVQPG